MTLTLNDYAARIRESAGPTGVSALGDTRFDMLTPMLGADPMPHAIFGWEGYFMGTTVSSESTWDNSHLIRMFLREVRELQKRLDECIVEMRTRAAENPALAAAGVLEHHPLRAEFEAELDRQRTEDRAGGLGCVPSEG